MFRSIIAKSFLLIPSSDRNDRSLSLKSWKNFFLEDFGELKQKIYYLL